MGEWNFFEAQTNACQQYACQQFTRLDQVESKSILCTPLSLGQVESFDAMFIAAALSGTVALERGFVTCKLSVLPNIVTTAVGVVGVTL